MYCGIAIRAMTAASWFCTSLRISPLGASAALSHLRKRPGAICLGTRPAMTPTGASGAMIITATGARAAMSAMAIGAATATMTAAVTIKAVQPGTKTAPSVERCESPGAVPRGPENTWASNFRTARKRVIRESRLAIRGFPMYSVFPPYRDVVKLLEAPVDGVQQQAQEHAPG